MKVKKIIPIILVICVVIFLATLLIGSRNDNNQDAPSESEIINYKLTAYTSDLEDSLVSLKSKEAIITYLSNWAQTKGVEYKTDSSGNVYMIVEPNIKYKKASPTVVICSYDSKNIEECVNPMAMCLFLAKNTTDTGTLTIVFTEDENHNFKGIQNIDKTLLTDDTNVICLNGGSRNKISFATGGSVSYEFVKDIHMTYPSGNKAIKIEIKGLPGGSFNEDISSYPNPIKILGNLLAKFKTNAQIYELAELKGGKSGKTYPSWATATIVINENDYAKFSATLDKAIGDFAEDYAKDYPDAKFNYAETDIPNTVIEKVDSDNLVGVVYTLLDGVYLRDDEDRIVSLANIGSIKEKNGTMFIHATGNSSDKDNLKDMSASYETLCSLSLLEYKELSKTSGFTGNKDTNLEEKISTAFKDYSGKDITIAALPLLTNASYVHKLNKNCDIVNMTVNMDRIERYTGTIITFLRNQDHKQN